MPFQQLRVKQSQRSIPQFVVLVVVLRFLPSETGFIGSVELKPHAKTLQGLEEGCDCLVLAFTPPDMSLAQSEKLRCELGNLVHRHDVVDVFQLTLDDLDKGGGRRVVDLRVVLQVRLQVFKAVKLSDESDQRQLLGFDFREESEKLIYLRRVHPTTELSGASKSSTRTFDKNWNFLA